MKNAPKSWGSKEYKDIRLANFYELIYDRSGGEPGPLKKALDGMQKVARDRARLPAQWDRSSNAGFVSKDVKPWMKVSDNLLMSM